MTQEPIRGAAIDIEMSVSIQRRRWRVSLVTAVLALVGLLSGGCVPHEHMSNGDQASTTNSLAVFEKFVEVINRHDAKALIGLMTEDHLFVDSLGNHTSGVTRMKPAWNGYFAMCPDYWIKIDNEVSSQDVVLAVGQAGGTIDNVPWRTPTAWKALVRENRVQEWRVFADNKPVYEILAKRKP